MSCKAISGREACRNNPDPDCLAAHAVGPLPPGPYSFASDKERRVSWEPKTNRIVAGIYLTKLWNREKFTPAQAAAILARDNIAIHIFQDIQLTNEIWCRSDVTPNLWGMSSKGEGAHVIA